MSEATAERSGSGVTELERRETNGSADRWALSMLGDALRTARAQGDARPPLAVVAACLQELGVGFGERRNVAEISLEQGRDEWLQRLSSGSRSKSALVAYRVAIDDLRSYLDRKSLTGGVLREETVVAYLDDYRTRARPAPATYYRRFTVLRRFFRWFSRRANVADPFLDLEGPRKPHQEADWLTPEEFARLLRAAAAPLRRRPGLAERDRLVLVALVVTGLRRAELIALDWGDLDLDSERPSLLSSRVPRPRPAWFRRAATRLHRALLPRQMGSEEKRRSGEQGRGDGALFCRIEEWLVGHRASVRADASPRCRRLRGSACRL